MFEEKKKENEIEELTGATQTPSEELETTQEPNEEPTPMEENNVEVEETETTEENEDGISNEIPSQEPTPMEEEMNVEEDIQEQPKMFDQNYVNELVGRTRMEARDKAMRALYDKYGVEDDNGLDEVFGRGQAYNILNDNYMDTQTRLSDALTENALLKSGIDQSRWDDAKFILGGKGLDITIENIAAELATHPEWMKAVISPEMQDAAPMRELSPEAAEQMASMPRANDNKNHPSSEIRRFGSETPNTTDETSEEDIIDKLFSLKR